MRYHLFMQKSTDKAYIDKELIMLINPVIPNNPGIMVGIPVLG